MSDGIIIKYGDGWKYGQGHRYGLPPNVPSTAPPRSDAQNKTKHMDFVPRKRSERREWLSNISDNVVPEAVKFDGAPADATAAKALADGIITKMDATDAAAAALDGARSVERTTEKSNLASLRAFFRHWKTLSAWLNSGSVAVLRVKGEEEEFDASTYKPVIKLSIEAGKIVVDFKKLGADGLAIYCRLRGETTWRKLGVDYVPPYYDTAPLAQPGVAEVREYMARGVVDDEEIGQDSDIVSISFGG